MDCLRSDARCASVGFHLHRPSDGTADEDVHVGRVADELGNGSGLVRSAPSVASGPHEDPEVG